ncbi:glucose 1-dehydrogenase [Flagellatimonas centrodinii]|uniref:glucose 1-dehydrogenase n=1 Tax=Flagellatimonas centrodinii TaxID=2806210 RepID=UPI001FF8DED0|nr:glucose 1-dehydrogenase [Flagellatimonas centrodinii]ULQ46515.1 glucose 1-dehydrogenase [Flagellatimonas centrodinii]
MKRVENKVCVITGGARGLGLAAAERLLAQGAKVLITDLDVAEGRAAAERMDASGQRVAFCRHDVTVESDWTGVLDLAEQHFGGIDVLVNNAGIALLGDIETLSFADWKKTQAVNADAVFLGTQMAIARMKEKGGSIINIASIEGLIGEPIIVAYNASKAAVRLLTRAAAIHCARAGYPIRINAVCPGFAATQLVSGAMGTLPADEAEAFVAKTLARIPMGRFADPAEIAQTVVFLASDESSYMTGSDLVVDGGMTA